MEAQLSRAVRAIIVRMIALLALLPGAEVAHADHPFTITGQFTCTSQGITMPVEGAIVGIMRDKPWAADPIVAEVRTAPDGTFVAQVNAKDVDTYYAKLFMNDKEGVFLHDWWTLNIREYNSATRGDNDTPNIDLGSTDISRDGGRGTPECAIWQGGRRAWQEYVAATGQRPLIGEHGNYQITMESTDTGIVWTSRDTTHWEIGYETGAYSQVSPVSNPQALSYADLFQFYGTNVHEFGHALRHTADGSDNHFTWDATRFFYGHSHDFCSSYPSGISHNAGYGFNEGWADYWQGSAKGDIMYCVTHGLDLSNFDQEAAVAYDLEALQNALGSCAGITGSSGDDLVRRRRAAMFLVLSGAGHEKIHSENDFRAAFAQRFPSCTMPGIGALSATIPASSLAALNSHPVPIQHLPFIQNSAAKQAALSAAIAGASSRAATIPASITGRDRVEYLTSPARLRGKLALQQLVTETLSAAATNPASPAVLMSAAGQRNRAAQVAAFDRRAREIALQTLTAEREALLAQHRPDVAQDLALINAEIAAVQSGSNRSASTFLNDAMVDQSEAITARPIVHFKR